MTLKAGDLRAALIKLDRRYEKQGGMTQVSLARLLGIAPRTLRHWLAGRGKASEPFALLVQLLLERNISPSQLRRIRKAWSEPTKPKKSSRS